MKTTVQQKPRRRRCCAFWSEIPQEVKSSLLVSFLLTCATACQLVADTVISMFVGKMGSDLSAARGEVATILGFAFFIFGFLTDGFTARVATAAGTGDKALVGQWIKLALVCGIAAGIFTLLAFGPTYQLWLRTFDETPSSPTWSAALVLYFTRMAGMLPNLVYNAMVGVVQGLQQPFFIVIINVALAVVDIFFNWLFLEKLGWSVTGSPLGVNVAFALALAASIAYLLLYKPVRRQFSLQPWRRMLPRSELIEFAKDSFSLMARSLLVELSAYLLPVAAKQLGKPQLVAYTTVFTELAKYSYYLPLGLGTAANMLGSYYRGKGDMAAFRRLMKGLPLIGLVFSGLFVAAFIALGPWVWGPFFLNESDADYSAIESELRSAWWLLVLQQGINVLLAVYEGACIGAAAFTLIRNTVVSGFFLLFLPLLAAGWWGTKSLVMLMAAKAAYDAWRAGFYVWFVHVRLQRQALPTAEDTLNDGGANSSVDGTPSHASLASSVSLHSKDSDKNSDDTDDDTFDKHSSTVAVPLLRAAPSSFNPPQKQASVLLDAALDAMVGNLDLDRPSRRRTLTTPSVSVPVAADGITNDPTATEVQLTDRLPFKDEH